MYKRYLELNLPKGKSCFLWGPRQTGKTTYLKRRFPESVYYDFLKRDLHIEFLKEPNRLRGEIAALPEGRLESPIILDEIQKIPELLDEIHWIIENIGAGFILSGSSARKLRRGHVNLLGGRAWRFNLFPLTSEELGGDFDLLRALNNGLIPVHYGEDDPGRSLKAYVLDYLKEEIFDEGLTRNLAAFSRFLDIAGYSNASLVNYTNIARECGVDAKTVREYFQILQDTLVGTLVEPFQKRAGRAIIRKTPKFYFFDTGVANQISKTIIQEPKGELFGRSLEHLTHMELAAYASYSEKDFDITFWRTKYGQEVDFVLGDGEVAIEVKGKKRISNSDLKHLKLFDELHAPKKSFLVSLEERERRCGNSTVLNWRIFLKKLWNGKII